jgi:hypothetical protein
MSIVNPTDYKASAIKGKQRSYGGRFGNEYGQAPWVTFNEEIMFEDGVTGAVYRQPVGSVTVTLVDPMQVITLRNPETDEAIGQVTAQDCFVMMYSLGRQAQIDRDVAMLVPPVE